MKGGDAEAAEEQPMVGGGKKSRKGSKKASRKGSKKASRKGSKKGSHKARKPNPGFMAFQKLKKHVADALGIPNSVQAAKIAGAALKKVKSGNADMDSVKAAHEAIKEFDEHKSKYEKMA